MTTRPRRRRTTVRGHDHQRRPAVTRVVLEVAADRSLTAIDVQKAHDNAITRRGNGSDFMDSHDVLAITEALLVPLATAALGAAGILIRDWRVRRDVENRRVRALADATAQAAFVEQWWKALQVLSSAPEDLTAEATNARALLAQAARTVSRSPDPGLGLPERPGAMRRLLMLYRFDTVGGRLVRAVFYLWLLVLAVVYANGVVEALGNTSRWSTLGDLSLGTLIFLLPAVVLRALAVFLEKRRATEPAGSGRPAIAPAPPALSPVITPGEDRNTVLTSTSRVRPKADGGTVS